MTLFQQLSASSSQMDKHVASQYLVNATASSHKYAAADGDCKGSLLRSLLSRPPTQAPCPLRPECRAEEPAPEAGSEWTSVVNVPFGPHRRIKWTWSASPENAAHLMVDNHQQTGARSVVFKPICANGKFASFETFAITGDRPLRRNAFTYWEVEVGNLTLRNATSVMVGLGTKQAKTRSCGYLNLIGIDEQSWGLSSKGFLWHNNRSTAYCKPLGSDDQESTIIGLLYDGLNGQLTFYVNGASAGRAFVGLGQRRAELYPMISSTASNSRFKMGPVHESIPTLKDLCRDTVLASMSPSSWNQQQQLPKSLVQFLN